MLFETSLTATPVFGLRREMNRLFDDTLARTTPSASWAPPVDVHENDHEIDLDVELPGVKPEDVDVTCDNGLLSIRGQKSAERKEGNEGEYHLTERTYGTFTRSFRLPKGVDDSKITADFENGVLHVRVPKAALPQPKKIQIGTRNESNAAHPQVQGSASSSKSSMNSNPNSQSKSNGGSSGSSNAKSGSQPSNHSGSASSKAAADAGTHSERGTGTNAVS